MNTRLYLVLKLLSRILELFSAYAMLLALRFERYQLLFQRFALRAERDYWADVLRQSARNTK